jgi:hypothetical protein
MWFVVCGHWTQLGWEFYPRGAKGQDSFYPVLRHFHLGMDNTVLRIKRNGTQLRRRVFVWESWRLAVGGVKWRLSSSSSFPVFGVWNRVVEIKLLEGGNKYDLTLALYNASAEVEYGTTNFEHVDSRQY